MSDQSYDKFNKSSVCKKSYDVGKDHDIVTKLIVADPPPIHVNNKLEQTTVSEIGLSFLSSTNNVLLHNCTVSVVQYALPLLTYHNCTKDGSNNKTT